MAWPMLIWPWIWFDHNGEFESSKSVMYESAPELKALMTILASTGPVISTRRVSSAFGTGAIVQSPSRIAFVSARKSGRSPASSRTARVARSASSSWRRGSNARCSLATSSSAGGVRMVSKPGRMGALMATPCGRVSVVMGGFRQAG